MLKKTSNAPCRRRTKWILGNVQNNYRNMTDYVNRESESSSRRINFNFNFSEGPTAKSSTMMWHRKKVTAGWAKTLSTVTVWEWYAVFLQILRSFVLHTSTTCHAKLKRHSLRNVKPVKISSFSSAIRRALSSVISYFRFRFTAAYKIHSVLFSSLCRSRPCWFMINIDSLMRRRLCGKLKGGRSQLLFALQQSSIDSQLFVEKRDFCLPYLHSTPRNRGFRRNTLFRVVSIQNHAKHPPDGCFFEDMFIHFDIIRESDWQTPGDGISRAYT